MRIVLFGFPQVAWVAAVTGLAFTVGIRAEDAHRYRATNPVWQAECSSCHVAYPPRLLPAESWRTLMAQLDHHFGVDASVDTQAAKTITAFLEANAGRPRRAGGTPLRITETRWFVHEHDEVPVRVWKSPAVKSAANCEACHTRAARGNFNERGLKMPR